MKNMKWLVYAVFFMNVIGFFLMLLIESPIALVNLVAALLCAFAAEDF